MFEKIRAGVSAAHFANPLWDAISPAAKHLIRQLLIVDPRKRTQVDKALSHPWMMGEATVDDEEATGAPLREVSVHGRGTRSGRIRSSPTQTLGVRQPALSTCE